MTCTRSWLLGMVAAAAFTSVSFAVPFEVNTMAEWLDEGTPNTPQQFRDQPLLYTAEWSSSGNTVEEGLDKLFETVFQPDGLAFTMSLNPDVEKPSILYLAMKAANHYVVWDISGWDAEKFNSLHAWNDLIFNSGKDPKPHQISHIAIYGSKPRAQVSDGGPILLMLGGAVGAIALGRRYFRRCAAKTSSADTLRTR